MTNIRDGEAGCVARETSHALPGVCLFFYWPSSPGWGVAEEKAAAAEASLEKKWAAAGQKN